MHEMNQVEKRVRALMADIFELSPDQAAGELRIGNPPAWDSMGHIRLLLTLEEEFGIRFPDHEVTGLDNVAAIVDALATRLGTTAVDPA
jgi:acyl carrier protein